MKGTNGQRYVLPNFLIIGAARSGSTWMSRNLSLHPEVFIPTQKELHFFDRDYDQGMDCYATHFQLRAAADARVVGEATPAYLHREVAAGRIHRHLPDAKLIVCLRDPVERLYSRYWNSRGRFVENKGLSFEEKLQQKPEFIEEGFYVDHLARYLDLWPRDRLLILLYDDLKAAPREFLKSMYEFLGVDPEFDSELAEHRVNAAAAQPMTVRSRPLYWLGKAVDRIGRRSLARKLEQRNTGRIPVLAAETRRRLIDAYYRTKNDQLSELLGRDLSHWNLA